MNETGVPCGPIYTLAETFADPQVQHQGIAQTVESEKLGPLTLIGQAIHMSRSTNKLVTATAECGAHTDEILSETRLRRGRGIRTERSGSGVGHAHRLSGAGIARTRN